METINFYKTNEKYGSLSNFSKHEVYYYRFWKTSEHAFQGMKFYGLSYDHELLIASSETPHEAAKLGRSLSPIREDWEEVKTQIMYEILMAKFIQNYDAREVLFSTGKNKIVEHIKNDSFWGYGGDGNGDNVLGMLLMKVRDELEKKYDDCIIEKLPPEKKFPEYTENDIGWRMGAGEDYLKNWTLWFNGLSKEDQKKYKIFHFGKP
ncbi:NADAR family protein [Marinicella sediminis]|uniref:NADAR family protein n=1 Tax=Marinicella sediminis TaxID=1792834 RepID=A0ABV7JKU5_9GAMM|nr:NADAR family protein [Marinicella sediminis]